ncbi:MAG TPA: site-2 protease family protein, partial [Acidimicrobiales bacterium]
MSDTIRLGRLAGVRIGLNWTLLAMVALIASGLADNRFAFDAPGYAGVAYGVAGALTAVVLLFGVLLHELGHAIVARRFGLRVDGITLSWMGGITRIEGDAETPGVELGIAGVGPLVSAAVGGLLWGVRELVVAGGGGRLVVSALGWLAVINVVLAVFNLLPAAPLDGGRVLHAVVWGVGRDRWRATRVAASAGVGLGALMVGAGFVVLLRGSDPINGFFIAFVGWWLLGSARVERQLGQVRHALDGVPISEIMRPVGAAPGWITVRAFTDTYASGRPGWVWLLERWDGGYGGVLLGDSLGSVPFPQWDLVRPLDVALPISAATGAAPDEDALEVISRTGGRQVILVVEDGRTVGAVLPADLEALVRMG